MVHDNDKILNILSSMIENYCAGYKITYEDINYDEEKVVGLYIRTYGEPTIIMGNVISYDVDFTIRLHGKIGGTTEISNMASEISNNIIASNSNIDGVTVYSIRPRTTPQSMGKTSKNIPIYTVSFVVKLG